jgi:hypothetical protein
LVERNFNDRDCRRFDFHGAASASGKYQTRDQASGTLIQTIQSEGWTRMLDLIGKLPDGADWCE